MPKYRISVLLSGGDKHELPYVDSPEDAVTMARLGREIPKASRVMVYRGEGSYVTDWTLLADIRAQAAPGVVASVDELVLLIDPA